jgi:hypothetical protein
MTTGDVANCATGFGCHCSIRGSQSDESGIHRSGGAVERQDLRAGHGLRRVLRGDRHLQAAPVGQLLRAHRRDELLDHRRDVRRGDDVDRRVGQPGRRAVVAHDRRARQDVARVDGEDGGREHRHDAGGHEDEEHHAASSVTRGRDDVPCHPCTPAKRLRCVTLPPTDTGRRA